MKTTKPNYTSQFTTEVCRYLDPETGETHNYVLQHDGQRIMCAEQRLAAIRNRVKNHIEWKDTQYFEKRGANLIQKLASVESADDLLSMLIKNANVISSTVFPYKDFEVILDNIDLEMTQRQAILLRFIRSTTSEYGFIAPKIIYLYQTWVNNPEHQSEHQPNEKE